MLTIIIAHRVQIRPETTRDASRHPKKISLRPCYCFLGGWGDWKRTQIQSTAGGKKRGGIMNKLYLNSSKDWTFVSITVLCLRKQQQQQWQHIKEGKERETLSSLSTKSAVWKSSTCKQSCSRRLCYQSRTHMFSEVLGLLPGSFCLELACSPHFLQVSQCPPTSGWLGAPGLSVGVMINGTWSFIFSHLFFFFVPDFILSRLKFFGKFHVFSRITGSF